MTPRRIGIGAAGIAAAVLFGGGQLIGGGAREGGLRMVWLPPAGYDAQRAVAALEAHGTRVAVDGDGAAVLDVPGIAAADVTEVARALATRQLAVREVRETREMKDLPRVLPALPVDIDTWRDAHGLQHADVYVSGDRAAIDDALGRAASAGWQLPAGTHIAYAPLAGGLRTYVVGDTAELTADDIADTTPTSLELTATARERFGELTARLAGHKLAVQLGEEISAAPIVDAANRTGHVELALSAADRAAVRAGVLPAGGTVRAARYAPADEPGWLARALVALGGGLLVGLGAFAMTRARVLQSH